MSNLYPTGRASSGGVRALVVLVSAVAIPACGGGGGGGGGVAPPPGILVVQPSSLSFVAVDNGPNPAVQAFHLSNTGASAFAWSATSSTAWVVPAPASGNLAPGQSVTVSVTVDASSFGVGTQTASITLSAPGATGTPITVAVQLTVTAAAPIISLSSASLNFTGTVGGANPAGQTVTLSNAGVGTLVYIATPNARWINVSPAGGTAPATLTVSVDITGLGQGVYSGFVTIWSSYASTPDQAANSPVRLAITLTVNPAAPPPGTAKWTILVWMNADNNLEGAGIEDINEMEAAGLPADVNVIVFVDRIAGHDSSNGDWTNARRYLITPDANLGVINSTQLNNYVEPNMGDPALLAGFCLQTIAAYPADKYGLVIWNHGGGWRTAGLDDTSADNLTLLELASALNTVQTNIGGGFTFDLLAFDECLMGGVETALEVYPYADVVVGSEEVTLGKGMNYTAALGYLAVESNASPQALGVRFSSTFAAFYLPSGPDQDEIFTTSAIDLGSSVFPPLITAIDALAVTLQTNMAAEYVNIARTIETIESFQEDDYNYYDLGDFCEALRQLSANATVQSNCATLLSALRSAMLFSDSGIERPHPLTRGLSIHIPPDAASIPAYQAGCIFAANPSPWVNMVAAYHAQLGADTIDPVVSNLSLSGSTVATTGTLNVSVDVSDNTVLSDVTIFAALQSGTNLIFLEFNHVCAPGQVALGDGRLVDLWAGGPYNVGFTWLPIGFAVSDGANTYLTAVELGCGGIAAEEAISVDAQVLDGSSWYDATLVFDAQTGQLLQTMVTVGSAIGEVQLPTGTQVRILVPSLDTLTGNVGSSISGTFTIGASPLFLTTAYMPPGSYELGVLAEDVSGNVGALTQTITVTP